MTLNRWRLVALAYHRSAVVTSRMPKGEIHERSAKVGFFRHSGLDAVGDNGSAFIEPESSFFDYL
jgi:hypothetical protein